MLATCLADRGVQGGQHVAIGHRDVEVHRIIAARRLLRRENDRPGRLGNETKVADRPNADAPVVDLRVAGQGGELALDRREDPGDLLRRPAEILRRENP